ncbi:MAG: tetratricopeptide repeat protein [Myxococcales bacterium]|nr:tetratricopeptide repeat protein [Myxococcales bacterium]
MPMLLLATTIMWVELFLWRHTTPKIPLFVWGLLFLAGFTGLQAIDLGYIVHWLSPTTADLAPRMDVGGTLSISYEPSATYRETTKLILYALVAIAAATIARRHGTRRILQWVVFSGIVVIFAAGVHRIFRIEHLWGIMPGARPAFALGTTFQNPNHAAGFCAITAWPALGLAFSSRRRSRQILYLLAAGLICSAMAVEPSKGGLLALMVGALVAVLTDRGIFNKQQAYIFGVIFLVTVLAVISCVFIHVYDAWAMIFGFDVLGYFAVFEKWAGIESAWMMAKSHYLVGIGRGAYVSAYPYYQTVDLQLLFAFPENIIAQFVSEWGVFVGLGALIGLAWMLWGRWMAVKSIEKRYAVIGLGALVFQNLFDFSTEMPGVALPAIAVCGSLSTDLRRDRLWLFIKSYMRICAGFLGLRLGFKLANEVKIFISLWNEKYMKYFQVVRQKFVLKIIYTCVRTICVLIPLMLAVFAYRASVKAGDLDADLNILRVTSKMVLDGGDLDKGKVSEIVERHPINALIAIQAAYIYEIDDPADLRKALKYANKALYLAPKYVSGYILASRVLSQLGYRDQAFQLLRSAWKLTSNRAIIVEAILMMEPNLPEILLVLPRVESVPERVDLTEAARLAIQLAQYKRMDLARGLLDVQKPLVDPSELDVYSLQRASFIAESPALALSFGVEGLKHCPDSQRIRLQAARAALLLNDYFQLQRHLKSLRSDANLVEQQEVLNMRVAYAMGVGAWPEAHIALDEMSRILPMSADVQTRLWIRRAEVYVASGHPHLALEPLARGLEWSPASLDIRMRRARVLERLKRRPEAIEELKAVLRRDSKHRAAKELLLGWHGTN